MAAERARRPSHLQRRRSCPGFGHNGSVRLALFVSLCSSSSVRLALYVSLCTSRLVRPDSGRGTHPVTMRPRSPRRDRHDQLAASGRRRGLTRAGSPLPETTRSRARVMKELKALASGDSPLYSPSLSSPIRSGWPALRRAASAHDEAMPMRVADTRESIVWRRMRATVVPPRLTGVRGERGMEDVE